MKIWTKEQVDNLKKRQAFEMLHPYTCVCGDHRHLIPTEEGWVCDNCDYTQAWAHDTDIDGSFLKFYDDRKFR